VFNFFKWPGQSAKPAPALPPTIDEAAVSDLAVKAAASQQQAIAMGAIQRR